MRTLSAISLKYWPKTKWIIEEDTILLEKFLILNPFVLVHIQRTNGQTGRHMEKASHRDAWI